MSHFITTKELPYDIRVATVISSGIIKPVWFEQIGKPCADRIRIKEICYKWSHHEGSAKILNFAVSDGANSYRLALNTQDFTWKLGIASN